MFDKAAKKKFIGILADNTLIISAGELIERGNHEVIIRALARINNPEIYYAIAGKEQLKDYLSDLAKELGVSDRVSFLSFGTAVFKLYHVAAISACSSKIEGLGLSGMEVMAAVAPFEISNALNVIWNIYREIVEDKNEC